MKTHPAEALKQFKADHKGKFPYAADPTALYRKTLGYLNHIGQDDGFWTDDNKIADLFDTDSPLIERLSPYYRLSVLVSKALQAKLDESTTAKPRSTHGTCTSCQTGCTPNTRGLASVRHHARRTARVDRQRAAVRH